MKRTSASSALFGMFLGYYILYICFPEKLFSYQSISLLMLVMAIYYTLIDYLKGKRKKAKKDITEKESSKVLHG